REASRNPRLPPAPPSMLRLQPSSRPAARSRPSPPAPAVRLMAAPAPVRRQRKPDPRQQQYRRRSSALVAAQQLSLPIIEPGQQGRAIIGTAKTSPASLRIDICSALLEEEGIRTNRQPPIHPANTHGYLTRLGAELVSRASQHSPALRASM